MKKKIGRKTYDTDNAERICQIIEGGGGASDVVSALYKRSDGEFFIHRAGGSLSPLAVPDGPRSVRGGETIEAVSEEAASEFAEKANVKIGE